MKILVVYDICREPKHVTEKNIQDFLNAKAGDKAQTDDTTAGQSQTQAVPKQNENKTAKVDDKPTEKKVESN